MGEGCNLQVRIYVPAGVSAVFFFFFCARLCKMRPNGLVAGTTGPCRTLVKNVNYGNGSHEEVLAGGWSPYQLDGSVACHFLGVTPERMRNDGSGALMTLKLPDSRQQTGAVSESYAKQCLFFLYTLTLPLFFFCLVFSCLQIKPGIIVCF